MNSARALTGSVSGTQYLLLLKALLCLYGGWSTRWIMVIVRGWWSAWMVECVDIMIVECVIIMIVISGIWVCVRFSGSLAG